MASNSPFYPNDFPHHILSHTFLHSTTDLVGCIHDNHMIMAIRMFFHPHPEAILQVYLSIYLLEFPNSKSSHPSCMLAAQASVTACHSEFQMAPIFPLMARRSGRQHIGEGGPRHAACSRGSIRERQGMRVGRGELFSIPPALMYSFFMIILETAFSSVPVWHG